MFIAEGVDGITAGLGVGFFGALVALFGLATKLMVQAAKSSDDRYQSELERMQHALDRKDAEIEDVKQERDHYYQLWLECRTGKAGGS